VKREGRCGRMNCRWLGWRVRACVDGGGREFGGSSCLYRKER